MSDRPDSFRIRFETSAGDFVVEAHPDWAPLGVARLRELVESGYYDDGRFFRVVPGFVVQFGLPAKPGDSWPAIDDDPVIESNTRGRLTFATAGPNTRTTQLFVNLGNNARLDGMGFAPVGEIVEGMDVVESLYSGYGEGAPHGRGPDQRHIRTRGNAYLDADFPELDGIRSANLA